MTDYPRPLFGTPRDRNARTRSAPVLKLAKAIGVELMPWQKYVIDVALEERRDGRLKYSEVNVLVPRQNGKTTAFAPLAAFTILTEQTRLVAYTAQGISDALTKWRFEIMPKLERSGFGKRADLKYYKSVALAGIECRKTGSHLRLLPSNDAAGHGMTVVLAANDEAWATPDTSIEQTYKPAGITVDDFQYWVLSVAGDIDSVYLREKVVTGRNIVKAGECEEAELAYFEYGVDEDADWTDRTLWGLANPALGYTITMDRLIALSKTMDATDFRRHHLNQWPVNVTEWGLPRASWEGVQTRREVPGGPVWLAADAPPRRTGAASIAGCGEGVLEILRYGKGIAWVGDELRNQAEHLGEDLRGIAFVKNGPLQSLADELDGEGLPVDFYDWGTLGPACERFHEAVLDSSVAIRSSKVLNTAVQDADTRDRVTGTWVWQSKKGRGPVSPLFSATMAYDLFVREPQLRRYGFFIADTAGDDEMAAFIAQREKERAEWLARRGG